MSIAYFGQGRPVTGDSWVNLINLKVVNNTNSSVVYPVWELLEVRQVILEVVDVFPALVAIREHYPKLAALPYFMLTYTEM